MIRNVEAAERSPADRVKPETRHDFTIGPLAVPLALFCLPILGSTLLQSLSATINAAWVGSLLGASALAAVTNANLLMFLLLGGAFGLVGAASILVSQTVGKGNLEAARKVIGGSVAWFMVVSIAIAVAVALALPLLLDALAVPPEVRADCRSYLLTSLAVSPAAYLFFFATGMTRAAGDARAPFAFACMAVVLDIILTPVLIQTGFGVAGSALASGVAQATALAALLFRFHRSGEPLLPGLAEIALEFGQLRFLLAKGVPMAMQTLVVASAAVVLVRFVNPFGAQTIAAYGAASQVWNLIQMPAFAISAGLMVVAGQNIGAGHWRRVRTAALFAVCVQLTITAMMVLASHLLETAVFSLFTQEAKTLGQAATINRQVAWSFVLLGASFVLFAPLRAAGHVVAPLAVAVVALWLLRFPYVILRLPEIGVEAVWEGIALGAGVSIVLSVLLYLPIMARAERSSADQ